MRSVSRAGQARRVARLASLWAGGLFLALVDVADAGTLLPERGGSSNADRIASLYAVILALAGAVFVAVTAALAYALVRYNRRRSAVAAQIRGNTRLELGWTAAATLLIVLIAVFSLARLDAIESADDAAASPAAVSALGPSANAGLRINVVGGQYIWMYRYPNGATSHVEMVATVRAVAPAEYARWVGRQKRLIDKAKAKVRLD